MSETTLTSKGQTTIPKAIREGLGLKTGDRLHFSLTGDGRALLTPGRDLEALIGCLPRPRRPVSLEDMDQAIARGAGQGLEEPEA